MYGKNVMKKVGSLVVVAAIIASAFAIFPGKAANGGIHDVEISTDYTGAVNGVKITRDGTDVVGADENLTIGEIYKIRYKLVNIGDYNETVNVTVEIGNTTWNDIIASDLHSLDAGDTFYGEVEWNTTGLSPGMYTITINASIADDANWTNNERSRDVNLVEGVPPITVNILYPVGGEVIGGIIPVQWTATDTTELSIKIEYKNDTATDWTVIAENEENDGIYYWDTTGLVKGENYKIRITATGSSMGYAESGYFTITQLNVTPKTAFYNDTVDVYVEGTSGMVSLYDPSDNLIVQQDGAPGDVYFFGITFDDTGSWYVEDTDKGIFYIWVKPITLNISVSPTEVDFARTGAESYVELSGIVKDPDGNGVAGVTVEVWAPGVTPSATTTPIKSVTTNATGHYIFTDKIRIGSTGAGDYNITARIGAIDDANAFGYTMFTVNPIALNITERKNDAVGGFDIGMVSFEVTDPDGNALLPTNDYNISIYKGNELYAWYSNVGGVEHGGPIDFVIAGKLLNLTSGMWESGDYTINISVDITNDGYWEYTGEEDYTINPAPPVTLKLLSPAEIDVEELANNAQIIQIQIFGENMTTYGTPEALGIGDNASVTDRIKVEGDLLYNPPKEAYEYVGNGIWNITVFPIRGNGKIYINVTWPDKGDANEIVNITDGGIATIEPTTVIVDNTYDITITVKTKDGVEVNRVEYIRLYYEDPAYYNDTSSWQLIDEKVGEYKVGGVYVFNNITINRASINIVAAVKFLTDTEQYAYARIYSEPAHDLNVALAPANVLAGEMTEFTVNITRNNESYSDNFEYYILNETELQKLHDGTLELPAPVYTGNKADDTFNFLEKESGIYYLYVRSTDKKHDNMDNEPSFEVSRASVTATPSLLVKNVDKNVTIDFTVTWNGEALNGTLKVYGMMEVASYEAYVDGEFITVDITNGEGSIDNVTAIAVGNLSFEFLPEAEGSEYAEAEGMLSVSTPSVEVVEPADKVALLAEENLITVMVKHPETGNGLAGLKVEILTPTIENPVEVGTTGSDGKLTFGIVPLQTGKIRIIVEGEEVKETIDIKIGLKIIVSSKLEKGKTSTILITTRGGKPVEGATVKIDGETYITDANGEIEYKPTEVKNITITAEKEGYYPAEKIVKVVKSAEAPGFELIGIAIAIVIALLIVRRRK